MGWKDSPAVAATPSPAWASSPAVEQAEPQDDTTPGAGRAFGRAALQGVTGNYSDEGAGFVQGNLQSLANALPKGALDWAGIDNRYQQDPGEVYRAGRDADRRANHEAEAAHPTAYGAGKFTGDAALQTGLGVLTGGASLTPGAQALIGGATGLGNNERELAKDMPTVELLKNLGLAGGEALTNAGLSYGGAKVGNAVGGWVGRKLAGASESLDKTAINAGRRVLTNGADQLSTRNPVRESAVREAIESKAIKPFGTTKGALERLGELTEAQGEKYNQLVAGLEERGINGPHARSLAMQLAKAGKEEAANSLGSPVPAIYETQAAELMSKPTVAGRLGLTQAENIKRSLQSQAKFGRFDETLQNEAKRDIASRVRQAIEDTIERQVPQNPTLQSNKELKALADMFVPTKHRMGNLIEAEKAATRGVARGAQRQGGHMPSPLEATIAIAEGHPAAMLTKPALGALKTRLPSTVAAGAMGLSKAMGSAGKLSADVPLANVALGPAARALAESLPDIVKSHPEMLGRYGRVLSGALANGGPEQLQAMDQALSQADPEYQKTKAGLAAQVGQ